MGDVIFLKKGFHLNSEGNAQLHYAVMKQDILDEILKPLSDPRRLPITVSDTIQRNTATVIKHYQMVYTKRALGPISNTPPFSFTTYPFG